MDRHPTSVPQPLTVRVPDGPQLDAGTVTKGGDDYFIATPATPMVDQLLVYLTEKPSKHIGIQSRHMGVGMAALCVRWGSYLATLLDADAPSLPDLETNAPMNNMRLITDCEMRRMNIEVSYAIARLGDIFCERGLHGLVDILTRAYHYLPMPQKSVQMTRTDDNQERVFSILSARLKPYPAELKNRAIANALAYTGWRNAGIERFHGSNDPSHPLQPHQRRIRSQGASLLLRHVSGNFAFYYHVFEDLFGDDRLVESMRTHIKEDVANSRVTLDSLAHGWSLTDASAAVTLLP